MMGQSLNRSPAHSGGPTINTSKKTGVFNRKKQKVRGVKGGSHAGSEWGVVVKAEGDEVAVQL